MFGIVIVLITCNNLIFWTGYHMRIKITFNKGHRTTYLPINTNYYLIRLINHLTYEYHRYLSALLPIKKRGRKFDVYTFSQLVIPEREVCNFKIGLISREFYWYVSSPYYQFLGLLAKKLRERKQVRIHHSWFTVSEVAFIRSPEFKDAQAQFTCLSPVAVYRQNFRKHADMDHQFKEGYILPEDNEYISTLERDLTYKYNLIQKNKRKDVNISLEFDQRYIKRRNNKITKIITLERNQSEKKQIFGVLAPLHIKAEPEVLKLIYDAGLGQLNDLGFGMVETVNHYH